MKTYFLTVDSVDTALKIDPSAERVMTLPAAQVVHVYCCQPPQTGRTLPERYVCRVKTDVSRMKLRKMPGVVRVRTTPTPSQTGKGGYVYHREC